MNDHQCRLARKRKQIHDSGKSEVPVVIHHSSESLTGLNNIPLSPGIAAQTIRLIPLKQTPINVITPTINNSFLCISSDPSCANNGILFLSMKDSKHILFYTTSSREEKCEKKMKQLLASERANLFAVQEIKDNLTRIEGLLEQICN